MFSLRDLFPRHSESKKFSITLSPPLCALGGVVLLVAIGWAFFMGFMVGKGQHPAESIQSMTGGLLQGGEEAPSPVEEPMAEIPADPAPPETAAVVPPPNRPTEAGLKAWPAAPTKKAESAPASEKKQPPEKPKKQAEKPKQNREIFNYTFQLAALKTLPEAENLNKRLKAQGIRATVKKSGKVYLAITQMRGGEAELVGLRKKLQTLKLGKPLLLSKKSVRPGK